VDGERSFRRLVASLDERIPRASSVLGDLTVRSSEEIVIRLDFAASHPRARRLGGGDVLVACVNRVRIGVLAVVDRGRDGHDGSSSRRIAVAVRAEVAVALSELVRVVRAGRHHRSSRVGSVRVVLGVVVFGTVSLRVDGTPGHRAGHISRDLDRPTVEVFRSLTPLDDGESLDS
jgi:hypothetical protein